MKKLIIVLMVVAMASFLFVGCLPGTTTPVTPVIPVTPVTPTPTTVTPIIIGVTGGAYINAAEAAASLTVNGTAPTYSEVKVYIDGICAGTGATLANGTWTVVIAKADLGADGAKVLHATATETGLAASGKSNEIKFTLDTVAPKISSSKAKDFTLGTAAVARVYNFTETTDSVFLTPGNLTGKFTENLVETQALAINTGAEHFTILVGAVSVGEQILTPFTTIPATNPLGAGVINWKLEVISWGAAGLDTIRVYNLTAGTFMDYSFTTATAITSTSWISGLIVNVAALAATDVGGYCLITTTNTPAVAAVVGTAGYIDVTFDEDVTGASILAGTWTAYSPGIFAVTPTVRSSKIARITENVIGFLDLADTYIVICSGISDLADNTIAPLSTSTGVVMP